MKHRLRSFLGAVALFALLTAIMTWPQALRLSTHASEHHDVYFNMWRLGWVAHALSSPATLFDGNFFYPEQRVLTFSDAMIVEALTAAPLLWAGVPPVLVHNLILLGGIVLSAAGVFMLARHLTGSTGAAAAAGVVFAFAPYRFEHYMHLELQWAIWIPWAFWALDHAVETGKQQYGVMTGVFIALQFMSSIYYGIFLATLISLAAVLLLLSQRHQALRRSTASLALGAVVGAALCLPYALPYIETKKEIGARAPSEIATYSARPADYLVATPANYLYGSDLPRRGGPERRLFPGVLAALLALTAVMVSMPSTKVIVYVLVLVAAFEMSLGVGGYSYPLLYEHVSMFKSLRAPARLGILVLFLLAILAAHGYAALERLLDRRFRTLFAAAVCGVLMLEYWVAPLCLAPYPNDPPPLYAWLARQPRGVVAEFPMPAQNALPGDDPRYAYMSTFHWMPTLNGYSGFYPASYVDRLMRVSDFPGDRATLALRRAGVTYVIVHQSAYPADQVEPVLHTLAQNPAYAMAATFDDGRGKATVFRLR